MSIDEKVRDEKLQYDTNREARKVSALSSAKINKYEYLAGEKVFPFDKSRTTKEANFSYPPLGKASEKETKVIQDQGRKQVKALKVLKPAEQRKIKKCKLKKLKTYF